MKKISITNYQLPMLILLMLGFASCFPVRIVTTAPTQTVTVRPTQTVTTVSSVPASTSRPAVTTTVQVNALTSDLSYYLDLQAVAAAFAQSSTVREFEELLNSSRYMINNLDLNGDGWVDYLRVLETVQGYRHVYLIQACLAQNIYQDVATLVAEARATELYVEIIGDPYIYGAAYIVRPVWVKRPSIWSHLYRSGYTPWRSTCYYGSFPSYYKYPKPMYISHYQAYIESYMHNHNYCHHCDYPTNYYDPHYNDHTKPDSRHDYEQQYPQNSFSNRNSRVYTSQSVGTPNQPQSSQRVVRNAAELRQTAEASSSRSSTTSTSGSSTRTSTTSGKSTTSTTTTTSGTTGSSTRTSSTSTTTTSGNSGTSTRSGSTATSTTTSKSSTQTTPATRTSTTITSRVSTSGTTRTSIQSVDSEGRKTSTTRTSTPSRTSTTSTSTQRGSSTSTSGSSTSGTRTRK